MRSIVAYPADKSACGRPGQTAVNTPSHSAGDTSAQSYCEVDE